jgi:hypothetical protein
VQWSWLPWLGDALKMGDKPLELLKGGADAFGEIFGLVVGGNRMFIITDPHSYDVIFKASAKKLSVEEFHNTVLQNFFGVSRPALTSHAVNDSFMRSLYSKVSKAVVARDFLLCRGGD